MSATPLLTLRACACLSRVAGVHAGKGTTQHAANATGMRKGQRPQVAQQSNFPASDEVCCVHSAPLAVALLRQSCLPAAWVEVKYESAAHLAGHQARAELAPVRVLAGQRQRVGYASARCLLGRALAAHVHIAFHQPLQQAQQGGARWLALSLHLATCGPSAQRLGGAAAYSAPPPGVPCLHRGAHRHVNNLRGHKDAGMRKGVTLALSSSRGAAPAASTVARARGMMTGTAAVGVPHAQAPPLADPGRASQFHTG